MLGAPFHLLCNPFSALSIINPTAFIIKLWYNFNLYFNSILISLNSVEIFIWYDNTFVPQIISLTFWLAAHMVLWPELLCSNCARPCHEANSWGWDTHSFSSVYHAGKGFQKLLSHKNSMHLNATAHSQCRVIFRDNTVFFASTVCSRRTRDGTFTGNYSSSALLKHCL